MRTARVVVLLVVPATAARGTYEVTTTVMVDDRVSRGMSTFVVD